MLQIILYYINFSGGIFCFTTALVVWFYFIVELDNHASSSNAIRRCSMIAILFYCITCFSTSYRISLFDSYEQPSTKKQWYIAYINFASWRVAQALTYIIFIQRMKQTFSNTKYASNARTYNTLYILSVIFMLLEPIKDISYEIFDFGMSTRALIVSIEFILSAAIDLVLSIFLLYLFLTKLTALNISLAELHQNYLREGGNQQILMNKYTKINNIIAKITLLTSLSLISTQILITLFAVEFFIHNRTDDRTDNAVVYVSYGWIIFWSIDCCINCICIFWSFDFALKWYWFFCKPFHQCCVTCCTKKGNQTVEDMFVYHRLNLSVNEGSKSIVRPVSNRQNNLVENV
eukprot:399837_1